jgi:hypothetical protein
MDPNARDAPPQTSPASALRSEKDWTGSGWKHPYVIYLFGTLALFAFLLLMGYLAIENEWIPKRGERNVPQHEFSPHRMITLQPFNPAREG